MVYFKKNVYMNKINMLYEDRIKVSEGIDINKTSASKEYDICHFWYFLKKEFKFHPYVHNGCHNVLMMSINIANLTINSADYRCIKWLKKSWSPLHQHKIHISIHDIYIDRIVVSNMVSVGKNDFKYFIGYEDNSGKIMPLCVMLLKMSK